MAFKFYSFTEPTIFIPRTIFWRSSTFLTGLIPALVVFMTPAEAAIEREWRNVYPVYKEPLAAPVVQDVPVAENLNSPTLPSQAASVPSAPDANGQPVDLIADALQHDEATQIVTASGNVRLAQAGRILTADQIAYNLSTDEVRATGKVVLKETDGTVYEADDVELTDDMKDGFVQGLHILLTDGSRFTAEEGTRTAGTVVDLKQASYTPCEPCKEDPSKPPVWQLRAAEVTHDETEKTITYRDAWFEFAGVPLAYVPYFSHPDGSEDQKSGFLTPRAGYDSEMGASYQQSYYWAVAPDKDVTVGSIISTNVNPVGLLEYRQRFENARMELGGSTTYSERQDEVNGTVRDVGDEFRGHLYGEGLWEMSDQWRSGYNLDLTTDRQYLRQYDLDSEDVLENEIYVERLKGRNYTVGRVMAFQDLRISDRRVEQPSVVPEVIASFYGAPNETLGGRWNANLSALGLQRDGNGQDMLRGSAELGWQRRYVTGFGLVNTFDALLRGDAYNIEDRNNLLGGSAEDSMETRGFAQADWNVSYPFAKNFEDVQWVVEPIVSVTAATNVDQDEDIPNEDSRDFTLDPLNLFEANRSPGYDLIEDRSRMTYGLRTGLYGYDGYRGEIFFGQSHRFSEDDNPFSIGSGLSEQESDYVGQISANFGSYFDVDYRFQLENENLTAQRHELDGTFSYDRLTLNTRYFYADALEGSDLDERREQIRQYARFRIYDDWYLSGAVWYDFGENEGLRHALYGVDYQGQCLSLSVMAERTLTEDETGDSGSQIMLRLGLKNLGEFETSGISLGGGDNDDDDALEDFDN